MNNNSIPLNFSNQHFYIGLDVHKKRWAVTIRNNNLTLKPFSMNPSPKTINTSSPISLPSWQLPHRL